MYNSLDDNIFFILFSISTGFCYKFNLVVICFLYNIQGFLYKKPRGVLKRFKTNLFFARLCIQIAILKVRWYRFASVYVTYKLHWFHHALNQKHVRINQKKTEVQVQIYLQVQVQIYDLQEDLHLQVEKQKCKSTCTVGALARRFLFLCFWFLVYTYVLLVYRWYKS